MLSEILGYLPYLFKGYGIFFKIVKGIWDAGITLLEPHVWLPHTGFPTRELLVYGFSFILCIIFHFHPNLNFLFNIHACGVLR